MSDETSDKGPGDRRAHRPDPRYVEGDLVRVVQAMNQAEAEFVQGLLREEGIPSMLRRTRGFDVPDMLAAGPRDVIVPQTGHAAPTGPGDTAHAHPIKRPGRLPLRVPTRLVLRSPREPKEPPTAHPPVLRRRSTPALACRRASARRTCPHPLRAEGASRSARPSARGAARDRGSYPGARSPDRPTGPAAPRLLSA